MDLSKYETMDVVMLMSIVNMKLRDDFNGDLNALVKSYEMDQQILIDRLALAGFEWVKEAKQFR
jgi:hypothetical protein